MNDDYPYFKGIDDIENMSNEEYQKLSYDEKVIVWTTFYRKNPHRFVEHYLGIRLHFFQKIMIYLMFKFPYVILLCSRAVSKSFTTTITACAICLLYPNSKVLVTAFTKQQAALLITEKLQKELLGLSPILDEEIFNIKTGVNNTEVIFKNGSSFITSVSGEGARGLRSTVLVIDEFRLVKEDDLNAILIPTMIPRQAPYLMKQQYQHMSQQPKRIMLSSAYYKAHWMWDAIRLAAKGSYNGTAALFSTDYFTTIKHGIKKREQMIEAKNATDELNWLMEYCNICVGGAENQYYSYDLIGNAQVLKRAFYPRTSDEYLSTTKKDKNGIRVKTGSWFGEIPKTKDELRVVSMDVAYSKDSR